MSEIVTRKQAKQLGLSKYFTGVPCKNSHIAPRYVLSGTCEDCIRSSRAVMISPRAEVLPPQIHNAIEHRSALQTEIIELKKAQLAIQEANLALRTQSVAVVIQTRLQDRAERLERRARAAIVKSRLVDVYVLIDPTDYEIVTAMVWAYAVQREPLLRLEDVVTGREMKDSRFVLRCYPENKAEILKLTNEMFAKHTAAGNAEAVSAVIDLAQRQLAASAEAEGEWPEESAR